MEFKEIRNSIPPKPYWFMCVECQEPIKGKMKGSMKHPYCEACYTKVWHDDDMEYLAFLHRTHFGLYGGNEMKQFEFNFGWLIILAVAVLAVYGLFSLVLRIIGYRFALP